MQGSKSKSRSHREKGDAVYEAFHQHRFSHKESRKEADNTLNNITSEASDYFDDDDDDLHNLQTTGSALEYSDTSDDYSSHVITTVDSSKNRKKYKNRVGHERKEDNLTFRDNQKGTSKVKTNQGSKYSKNDEYSSERFPKHQSADDDVERQRGIHQQQVKDENTNRASNFQWMTHLAYAFRSPQTKSKKSSSSVPQSHSEDSAFLEPYPHYHQEPKRSNVAFAGRNDNQKQNLPSQGPLNPNNRGNGYQPGEGSPLLGSTLFSSTSGLRCNMDEAYQHLSISRRIHRNKYRTDSGQPHTLITLAATFLRDCEANRPPTFAFVEDLTDVNRYQTSLHNFKYSTSWIGFPVMLWCAAICMFISSAMEGFNRNFSIFSSNEQLNSNSTSTVIQAPYSESDDTTLTPYGLAMFLLDQRFLLTLLNMIAIFIFAIDLWLRHQLKDPDWQSAFDAGYTHTRNKKSVDMEDRRGSFLPHAVRTSRCEKLLKPLILFSVILALENVARLVIKEEDQDNKFKSNFILFSSIFKPLVLFYVSSKARDALEALLCIVNIVLRVLLMEMLLILMFAAVACRLFPEYESFQNLSTSWLSLFELATTVVNPSIWMPMYASNRLSAVFFIVFVITSVFFLHSLVLSVVFQTYIQSAGEIHERSAADREDGIYLAFSALLRLHEEYAIAPDDYQDPNENYNSCVIDIDLVRETLQLIRPHYNAPKINALIEIVDPLNQKTVDFPTFRTKIRQALNSSIRTARNPSPFALVVELVAAVVGVSNFAYVLMVTSMPFHAHRLHDSQEVIGCVITALAALELLVRLNPFRVPDFIPVTRLNATFDGLALVAAMISTWGIVLYIAGSKSALEWILMGRAIDMIRTMRFFPIFREVVRRSGDVVPALLGPLILVFTTLHIFCYLGMGLWGGAINVGAHVDQVVALYDLNNFNSYQEGLVTLFQILVVNDWHSIAQVFRYADRCSSAIIVYSFFVICNLVGVSIMLNVLTAFFVQSFVTKTNDDKDSPTDTTAVVPKERVYSSQSLRDQKTDSPHKEPRTDATRSGSKGRQRTRRLSSKGGKGGDEDRGTDADSEASVSSEMLEFDVYERERYETIMQNVTGAPYQEEFARQICHYFEVFESLTPHLEGVGYLVCDQQSLERYGNRRFKTKSIGCLEENELHVVITDMHAELLALAPRPSIEEMSLVRTFKHKRDPTKALEISAALIRRQPALSLFVSRTTKEVVAPSNIPVQVLPAPPVVQQYPHTQQPSQPQQRGKQKSKQSRKPYR